MTERHIAGNVARFSGFQNDYDKYRPQAPSLVIDIVGKYLARKPSLVVDLGCGTGLSSFVWQPTGARVIGVEPNDDMRSKAIAKLNAVMDANQISFVHGYSNDTGIDAASADVVTCSQSFHWMEPISTLQEIHRILKHGGVFAAYDCDWPPTIDWEIEHDYLDLMARVDEVLTKIHTDETTVTKWSKDKHLLHIEQSGLFRFTKEIVFHNAERCDASRYVGLALSQGGLQTVLKSGQNHLDANIRSFTNKVHSFFSGHTHDILFSYRMRLGVK